MAEHWFDQLNKAIVQTNRRRSLLGAAALLTNLDLGAPFSATASKGKKGNNGKGHSHGKGHRKHKDNHKNKNKEKDQTDQGPPPPLCGLDVHDACASTFSLGQHIQDCTDTCEHCRAAGVAFCISERDERPICCLAGERCCGDGIFGTCCPANKCCT